MRIYDIIKKKRDGERLTDEEIHFFVKGYVAGDIPDYQASALCMAIYFRGMDLGETTALTLAMRDSGETLHMNGIDGLRVDKHSTGGVGDKTSLIVAPIVATLGVKVAKMSGRGLGHTGGTVDKLEAIQGFRTDLDTATFERVVNEVGIAIVGQSANLAPADKLLYALRDVTATVDSLPLIASSIMSKKLAADDDCIVLDVKTGSGAFMKSEADSRALAEVMVGIGKRAGKRTRALITDMDRPLGRAIGNSLEVIEAIETLRGEGPKDLCELCVALATHMLVISDRGDEATCEANVRRVMTDGTALGTLAAMVQAQGGDPDWIYHPEKFPRAPFSREVKAPRSGYITHVDCEGYGVSALLLGAGRNTKADTIDPTAGILLAAKTGDHVTEGQTLATLYASKEALLDAAEARLLAATEIGDEEPAARPLIVSVVE
ncbi:MAG: pyrimidine-nucleoside phosphorylase [Clostridia bacterium]|nr:pyrimidine-nucleoside phosphorylase [Clostridia bacterium]